MDTMHADVVCDMKSHFTALRLF